VCGFSPNESQMSKTKKINKLIKVKNIKSQLQFFWRNILNVISKLQTYQKHITSRRIPINFLKIKINYLFTFIVFVIHRHLLLFMTKYMPQVRIQYLIIFQDQNYLYMNNFQLNLIEYYLCSIHYK